MSPYPVTRARLDAALAARDLGSARVAARELPGGITLADAAKLLMLMEEVDDPAFERAAVRWVARFASECRDVRLEDLRAAVDAVDGLRAPGSHAVLAALLTRV